MSLKLIVTKAPIALPLVPTCKVANCIDATEYASLSDPAKAGVNLVLSTGFVDLERENGQELVFGRFLGKGVPQGPLFSHWPEVKYKAFGRWMVKPPMEALCSQRT